MQEKYDLLLINGQCLVPDPLDQRLMVVEADLAIKSGKIVRIAKSLAPEDASKVLDLRGLHVLPGIIDSQVHFREPGMTHKEDLESGTRAAILGGVTSVFEMPNTNPSTTTAEALQDKLNRAKGRAHCNYAFFVGGSKENAHELNRLEKLPHCSGIKVFMGSSTGSLLVDESDVLEQILSNGSRRVIVHSEDEARLQERRHIATETKDVHSHPVWRDVESAVISTKKLLAFARKHKRKVHVLHISSEEEMAILREYKDIATVEVLPQHLTLFAPDCYDKLKNYAQQNPPIREKRHLEGIWKALQDGVVDVIGSDHAPHTRQEKDLPYPTSPSGLPGVQTLVPIMLNHVHEGRLSLCRFVEMVTENPRRVFGIKNKGRLQVDFDADITIIDMNAERVITNDWIVSKCGWTPFDGMKVKGWVTHTIVGGEIVMQNDKILTSPQGRPVEFLT